MIFFFLFFCFLFICSCLDYIEIFPYLREPVVENTTLPEYVFCNRTQISIQVSPQNNSNNSNTSNNNSIISNSISSSSSSSSSNKTISSPLTMSNIGSHANISSTSTSTTTIMHADDLPPHEFIYSSGKIFAIRLRFTRPVPSKIDNWYLNVTAEYRFLKKGKRKTFESLYGTKKIFFFLREFKFRKFQK